MERSAFDTESKVWILSVPCEHSWKCGFCKDLVSLESVDSARTLYEFWGKCGFCEDLVRVFEALKSMDSVRTL